MVGTGRLESLAVNDIELDLDNPRIAKFLEIYGGKPTAEQIFMALGAASDDENDTSTRFHTLESSILRNGGIIQPIIVNRHSDGSYLCIEGNTRLALYREFQRRSEKGDWSRIPALVYDEIDPKQANAIRLQVHLVGTRPWDLYSRAKYLHHLSHEQLLPFESIVEYAGGRKQDIVKWINAYESMEKYYRPIAGDEHFEPRRFSGFVELQEVGVKEALAAGGFDESDFARWIHENKLKPLNTVRVLPRILKNERARDLFVRFDAKCAAEVLDKPAITDALTSVPIGQLARAMTLAAMKFPYHEADLVRRDPGSELALALREAHDAIAQILEIEGLEE